MIPPERSSLRAAILISLALYAVFFASLELWAPLDLRGGAAATGASNANARPSRLAVRIASVGGPDAPKPTGAAAHGSAAPGTAARAPRAAAAPAPPNPQAHVGGKPAPAAAVPRAREGVVRDSPAAGARTGAVADVKPSEASPSVAPPLASVSPPRASSIDRPPGSGPVAAGGGSTPGGTPGAARSAAGGYAPGGADPAAVLSLLRKRIENARVYPIAARERDIQGSVKLWASIAADGRLAGSRVVVSSGSAILDRAGLALLRKVFPVPNALGYPFTLDLTVAYRLTGSEAN